MRKHRKLTGSDNYRGRLDSNKTMIVITVSFTKLNRHLSTK